MLGSQPVGTYVCLFCPSRPSILQDAAAAPFPSLLSPPVFRRLAYCVLKEWLLSGAGLLPPPIKFSFSSQ